MRSTLVSTTALPDHEVALAHPVFLVGAERSGTTLLRLMLDNHPQIRFHHEFDYVVDYMDDNGTFPSVADFAKAVSVDRVFQDSHEVLRTDVDYLTLVRGFLRAKLTDGRARIVGATVHRHVDRLLHLWPRARFIHIVRDPRDVCRSRVAMGWDGNTWTAAAHWIDAETRCEKLKAAISADRWISVRYESLVERPANELQQLCEFLELPWESAMLTYPERSTYSEPDPSLALQWRHKATAKEVQMVEARVGGLLTSRGFEPSGLPPLNPSKLDIARMQQESRLACARFRARRYGWPLCWAACLSRRLRWQRAQHWCATRINTIDRRYVK